MLNSIPRYSRREHSRKKMRFYLHMLIFAVLMPLLIGLNFFFGEFPWSTVILMLWGAVLIGNWFMVSSIGVEWLRKRQQQAGQQNHFK